MKYTILKLKKELAENNTDLTVNISDDVLIVSDKDLQHYPIYVTITDKEITCMATIVSLSEIQKDKKAMLNEILLNTNPNLNLSNFGIFGDNYVVFGELSSTSTFNEIVLELDTLFDNIGESLKVFQSFVE